MRNALTKVTGYIFAALSGLCFVGGVAVLSRR